MNCWEILEITYTDDFIFMSRIQAIQAIEVAHRKLIKKYHPDVVSDPELKKEYTAKCAQINNAYKEAQAQINGEDYDAEQLESAKKKFKEAFDGNWGELKKYRLQTTIDEEKEFGHKQAANMRAAEARHLEKYPGDSTGAAEAEIEAGNAEFLKLALNLDKNTMHVLKKELKANLWEPQQRTNALGSFEKISRGRPLYRGEARVLEKGLGMRLIPTKISEAIFEYGDGLFYPLGRILSLSNKKKWLISSVVTFLGAGAIEIFMTLLRTFSGRTHTPWAIYTPWAIVALVGIAYIVIYIGNKSCLSGGNALLGALGSVLILYIILLSLIFFFIPNSLRIDNYYGVETQTSSEIVDLGDAVYDVYPLESGALYKKDDPRLKNALEEAAQDNEYVGVVRFLFWQTGAASGFSPVLIEENPIFIEEYDFLNKIKLFFLGGMFFIVESFINGFAICFIPLMIAQIIFFLVRKEHYLSTI